MEISFIQLDETPSTNAYLKQAFLRGECTGATAVTARRQTAGRGRLGRVWESEPDTALALSVLIPKALPGAVTLAAGVAVTRAIARVCGIKTQLKWPNDSICADKKIGGILCEGLTGEHCATVIGIGINVGQSAAYFEEKGLPYGGSLLSAAGVAVSPNALAKAVLEELSSLLDIFEASGFAALREEYERACLTLGAPVSVLSADGGVLFSGEALTVNDEGNLLVRDTAGTVHTVCAGEVSVRGVYGYV